METRVQAPLELVVRVELPILVHPVQKGFNHIILREWADCHRPLVADFYDILILYVVVNPVVDSFAHRSRYQRRELLIVSVSSEDQDGTFRAGISGTD